MSGRKRSLVVEAIEFTIMAIQQARARAAAERVRLGQAAMTAATRELAAAQKALDAAGKRIDELGECDERAELTARHQALQRELAEAKARMMELQGSFGGVKGHLDQVDSLVKLAERRDRELRKRLYDEDRRMEQNGLPTEWFRDTEYREADEARQTADQAMAELRSAGRDSDAIAGQVRELADSIRGIGAEAKVLQEFTGTEEFNGILERIADRKAFAAIAARREELAAGLARLPEDYADWCAPEQMELATGLAEADAALQEAESLAHPAAWDGLEAALASGAAHLAELPGAIAEAGENRDRQERRARIAEAIMTTLDELQFDVSFDPGNRDEPCRISGQTPRSDGDGDFDIAIPLSGEVTFEVAEARGDGHDCHAAVMALQERLKERFGMSWEVTDWGNAAGFADAAPGERHGAEAAADGEKQRAKHQQRERERN